MKYHINHVSTNAEMLPLVLKLVFNGCFKYSMQLEKHDLIILCRNVLFLNPKYFRIIDLPFLC